MSPRDSRPEPAPLGTVHRDERDLRDRLYEPALAPLAARLDPDPALLAALAGRTPIHLPRDQGDEGSCGGHALAALIDVERLRAAGEDAPPAPVSARMIQTMASRHDAMRHGPESGVSLRDVIKGFYNYGVCPETDWPYVARDADRTITAVRAKAARDVSLGAYYRLRPNLNTYHSALRETGAVLVSAELHPGWSVEAMGAGGRIPRPEHPGAADPTFSGGHAFVLVGYDREGFLVLNSWGRGWGGLEIDGTARPGLAHWSYGDWADAIMDGWVLRLGVRAPEAFEFSIGDMGLGLGASAVPVRRTSAAPVRTVLGHYLHLDDGRHVERGAFASDRQGVAETFDLLARDAEGPGRYRGVLLTFAGGLLNLADAAAQIAHLKAELWRDRERGDRRTWYPLTALWCVDYVEEARAVLEGVFADALAQIGRPGPDLDRLIEARAHGVGRALWRDVRAAAEASARPDAPLAEVVDAAAAVARKAPRFGLCAFAEGEGAFALAALAQTLAADRQRARAFYAMLRSVDVVAPPVTLRCFDLMARRIGAGWAAAGVSGRLRLHLPPEDVEDRLGVPPYGGSYFDLVANAFLARAEREPPPPPKASRRGAGIHPRWRPWFARRGVEPRPIRWRAGTEPAPGAAIAQRELIYGSDVMGRVRAALADAEQ